LPRTREFVERYQKSFAEAPDVHAALAYDNARVLFEAMRQARSFEGPKVRTALAGLKTFDSLTGPWVFGKDGWVSRRVFVVRLKDGQAKTVKTFGPEDKGP